MNRATEYAAEHPALIAAHVLGWGLAAAGTAMAIKSGKASYAIGGVVAGVGLAALGHVVLDDAVPSIPAEAVQKIAILR